MQNANHQNEAEFNESLKAWEPPDIPTALDQRVLESYRRHTPRRSWWERFFTTSVRVPLPLVALQAMLLLMAGGGFIAFYATQAEEALPLARNAPSPAIIEVPVVKEKTIFRTAYRVKQQPLPRSSKTAVAAPVLPLSAPTRPPLTPNTESLGWPVRAELYAPKPPAEWPEVTIGLESRLILPTSLGHNRITLSEPLQPEWRIPFSRDFSGVAIVGKPPSFEGRLSRTVSRASGWVTKPLEKTEVLYRWIPNALPAVNSFVAPAKNACFSPFRSKPEAVNLN
jgi:hypothetical protein